MKKIICAISLSLICTLFLSACNSTQRIEQTPEETVQTAFTALKDLDMKTFNACTNNKRDGRYRLFDELIRKKKDDKRALIAQALVENLSWEINSIEINNNKAIVEVTIQNKDFSNSVGLFVADLIQECSNIQEDGTNLASLTKQMLHKTSNIPETLLPYIQNSDKNISSTLSVNLKKIDNAWQIQLDDTLCDTLMGNMGSEEISENVQQQINAAEELLNRNLERWGYHIENSTEQWAEQFEDKIEKVFG